MILKTLKTLLVAVLLFCVVINVFAINVCPKEMLAPAYPKAILPCDFVNNPIKKMGAVVIQNDATMHYKVTNYSNNPVKVLYTYFTGCANNKDHQTEHDTTITIDANSSQDINYTTNCTYARVYQFWPGMQDLYGAGHISMIDFNWSWLDIAA